MCAVIFTILLPFPVVAEFFVTFIFLCVCVLHHSSICCKFHTLNHISCHTDMWHVSVLLQAQVGTQTYTQVRYKSTTTSTANKTLMAICTDQFATCLGRKLRVALAINPNWHLQPWGCPIISFFEFWYYKLYSVVNIPKKKFRKNLGLLKDDMLHIGWPHSPF